MVAERVARDMVSLPAQDISHLEVLCEHLPANASTAARLIAPDGTTIEIPASLYDVLRQVVRLMAEGAAIGLVPVHRELTTQEAADLLNMSRPSLIKLLDAGQIPYHRREEGAHRRVRFADVMAYKERRSETRRAALAEMAAIGQKYGAYEAGADDGLFDGDEAEDARG